MEYSAIFHDMDKRFCYAIEKDLFVIRVQVKKDDMKEIILHYCLLYTSWRGKRLFCKPPGTAGSFSTTA